MQSDLQLPCARNRNIARNSRADHMVNITIRFRRSAHATRSANQISTNESAVALGLLLLLI